MLKCRGGGNAPLTFVRRTSLTFTCIKSECPAQARIGGGMGVSNDWCVTLKTKLLNFSMLKTATIVDRGHRFFHSPTF